MAFVANNSQQLSLNDSAFGLSQRELRFLENSWAKHFAEKIFPAIREEEFSPLYSSKASRPNTPVNVIVGALILKEALGLTDDEIVQSLMFDLRFQYALHTTSFEEQPLSDRTISRFRARNLAYETETGIDLIHQCVRGLAEQIAAFMGITPAMQRMDSLLVAANIRNLSVLELFYTCVANLVKAMKNRADKIPDEQKHYVEQDDYNHFIYHLRNTDIAQRTQQVLADAVKLIALCEGGYDDASEYQLLIRLLKEQSTTNPDGTHRLKEKSEKTDTSKALLNPSDPEATFRKKAGRKHLGYVANITESVSETGSVVADYAYEQNIYSDSQFLKDYLAAQVPLERECILVADGAYGSEKNVELAKECGINLITTNFTGVKPAEVFAEFKFNEAGTELLECINGKHPYHTRYDGKNDRCDAHFSLSDCQSCPYKEQCKPRMRKSYALVELSWKAVHRAKLLRYRETDEFKELAHFRNGVEAIPSVLRRKYKVDKIPSHGKKQTRFHFGFKIAALNFHKLLNYMGSVDKCVQNQASA